MVCCVVHPFISGIVSAILGLSAGARIRFRHSNCPFQFSLSASCRRQLGSAPPGEERDQPLLPRSGASSGFGIYFLSGISNSPSPPVLEQRTRTMMSGLTVPSLLVFQSRRPRHLLVFDSGGQSWLRSPTSLHVFPSQPPGSFSPSLVLRVCYCFLVGAAILFRCASSTSCSGIPPRAVASPQVLVYSELRRLPPIALVCFGRLRGPGLQDYCALVGGCRELRFTRAARSASSHAPYSH
ncbi:hypothetical protein NDU88_004029 [Pleurodeles waltl]|uniref:Uncharacterized protein n=1 Tax=Pleurodeles waltl TaxID=8319 RepID=A0AAV7M5S1_PLEWA|nr:hypothetical protein NDU88_004029 [Pleurodeles waltl]